MTTLAEIIFTTAFIPYLLAWLYIRQLVREVNGDGAIIPRVSIWSWWPRGWRLHKTLFPVSRVRTLIIVCVALTVALGLIAFGIEVQHAVQHGDVP
jgi:hypothetical protein